MRGVTDRLTRYVADKILRDRVLNYTSDTLALWCSIPGDKFFYQQYQIYEKSALYGTPA